MRLGETLAATLPARLNGIERLEHAAGYLGTKVLAPRRLERAHELIAERPEHRHRENAGTSG